MTKRMLIDATHPEETRVAVVDGTRLEEFDFEMAARRQIKSNIYLAKVTRVEPSLQAAFVEYGGNRHGFLPFPEIHPDYYRIPVGDRPAYDDVPEQRWVDTPYKAPDDTADVAEGDAPETDVALPESMKSEATSTEPAERESSAPDDAPPEAAPDATDTMPAAAAADPFISEDPVGDEASGEDDAGEIVELVGEESGAATGDPATGEIVPVEEPLTVDVVGGDEVEDAQRRRRSQMPHYKIQEVIKRRQIMLVQVSKEERGNKGAAVTTFLSLPGRYCVLMPNTSRGGGVSRKIANPADRKRMKELISDLEVPDGMSVILRTAGVERSKAEIKRDLEYLLRLWENIRTLTLESTAPALIYEEGNLVKRAIRDLYTKDIEAIEIAGEEGYRQAKDFMRMLMPSHAKRVQPYRDPSIPLFFRYQVESQIDLIHNPVAHLKSGGYIVINQTEALVSIDVNSGRSTRERNIEETAVKTNCEAADEIARQLRLRDMGGLIVIDFIDMDEPRHDAQVERRLKEAMKNDRARIQVGRISPFGLLELSRQRLHPSLIETNFHTCAHCLGTGLVRSIESASLLVLRAIEEEGIKHRAAEISVTVAGNIALYILNQKRGTLIDIEQRYGFSVRLQADDGLIAPEHRIERIRAKPPGMEPPPLNLTATMAAIEPEDEDPEIPEDEEETTAADRKESRPAASSPSELGPDGEPKRKRRRNRRRRGRDGKPDDAGGPMSHESDIESGDSDSEIAADEELAEPIGEVVAEEGQSDVGAETANSEEGETAAEGARRRRRGRRGGRSRTRRGEDDDAGLPEAAEAGGGHQPFADQPLTEPEPVEPASFDEVVAPAVSVEPPAQAAEAVAELEAPVAESPATEHVAEPIQPEVQPEPASEPASEPVPPAPVARDYEVVNQPPAQPRRGFWKRLVE
ncbi:MAG: ribonuclease [Rhodospirillales bacterium]|nr:ribonuclease [Rhodospirillales bacterium]